jgi:hypothetical protein
MATNFGFAHRHSITGMRATKRCCLTYPASLPYNLIPNLGVTQIQAHHLVVEVKGDLQGDGNCRFSSIPDTAHTRIEFKWNVQACKPWMNWFITLTRPIFIWNHARVMRLGEQGLIRYFNLKVTNNME